MGTDNIIFRLAALPFAILLMVIAILLMLTGVMPVADGNQGVVFHTPVFVGVLGLLALSTLLCICKRRLTISSLGFVLVHVGILFIMAGALVGTLTERRTVFHLSPFASPMRYLHLSEGEVADLGFTLQLEKFSVEHYDPDLTLYRNDVRVQTYRISEGSTLYLVECGAVQINEVLRHARVTSYQQEDTPQLVVSRDGQDPVHVAITGSTARIELPEDGLTINARAYNNLPAMREGQPYFEAPYPIDPGLILRIQSAEQMAVVSLPANGEPQLLGPHGTSLTSYLSRLQYIFPPISELELSTAQTGGNTALRISTEQGVRTLLQDGGVLSSTELPKGGMLFVRPPMDKAYHATVKVTSPSGDTRIAALGTNNPLDEQGWRFYLNSYDPGPEPGITLTARHDPGNDVVVAGIWIVMIGMPVLFYGRRRKRTAC